MKLEKPPHANPEWSAGNRNPDGFCLSLGTPGRFLSPLDSRPLLALEFPIKGRTASPGASGTRRAAPKPTPLIFTSEPTGPTVGGIAFTVGWDTTVNGILLLMTPNSSTEQGRRSLKALGQ